MLPKHLNLIDIYGIPHPTAEYTFFSSVKGTFTKIGHMLDHKTRFNKHKIKIIQRISSDLKMKFRH